VVARTLLIALLPVGALIWWARPCGVRVPRAPAQVRDVAIPAAAAEQEAEVSGGEPLDGGHCIEVRPRLKLVEVVDESGRPVAAALVRAEGEADHTTDADGRAEFDSVETQLVTVRRAGYVPARVNVYAETVHVRLAPSQTAEGRALLPSGAPASGARIRVWDKDKDEDEEIDLEQVTDDDGRFAVTGIRRFHPVLLIATLDGYAPVVRELADTREVTLRFGEGATVSGSVAPAVAGVEVILSPAHVLPPWELIIVNYQRHVREELSHARARTDVHGRFVILGAAHGAYRAYACAQGGRLGSAELTVNGDCDVEIRVLRRALLTVNVLTPDGRPVEDADVTFLPEVDRWRLAGDRMELTPGRRVITASGGGYLYARAEVDLAPGESRTIEVNLRRGLPAGGTVLDEQGAPIDGASVSIWQTDEDELDHRQEATTDELGRWKVDGLAPAPGRLTVGAVGHYNLRQEIEVREGARYEARLQRVGRLVGRLVPAPGEGKASYHLDENNGSLGSWFGIGSSFEVEADGRFEVKDPGIEGWATLTIFPDAKAPIVLRELRFRRGETVDLGDLELRECLPLRLTVLDESGRPLPGALVELCHPKYVPGLRTDEHGRLECGGQAQMLTLRIDAPNHAIAYRVVDASQPITIKLERGAAFTGIVLAPGGKPVPGAYVVFHRLVNDRLAEGQTFKPDVDGFGRFAMMLPAGAFKARTYGEGRQELPGTFEATEGAAFELHLR